jgi:hypothetical protein
MKVRLFQRGSCDEFYGHPPNILFRGEIYKFCSSLLLVDSCEILPTRPEMTGLQRQKAAPFFRSETTIMLSNPYPASDFCVSIFSACVIPCESTILATGRYPIRGVLPTL